MNPSDSAACWAREKGAAALAEHDLASAARLFAYACRNDPNDLDLTLRLGSLQLRLKDPAARETFTLLARTYDIREGWFGLATAAMQAGARDEAAALLARALSHHAPLRSADFFNLCTRIALENRAPGWCALSADGVLRAGACPGQPSLCIDGRSTCVQPTIIDQIWQFRLSKRIRGRHTITVLYNGSHLLGSPIAVASLTRVEGFVDKQGGGLAGWVWLPGDPDYQPHISVRPVTGRPKITARARKSLDSKNQSQRWCFTIPAEKLRDCPGPLVVMGPDERPLLGSPLDPTTEPQALLDRPPHRKRSLRLNKRRDVDVIIPVYRGRAETLSCLVSVLESIPQHAGVVVVDDASPATQLCEALDALAHTGRIRLIRHRQNRGFPGAANAGMRAATKRDVILLNSDTLVAHDWLERLQRAALGAPYIGTVTPFTNDGNLVSYPNAWQANPAPDRSALATLDQLAHRANGDTVIDIPTAVGFCMYIRRDCLDDVGYFREDVFAQGYGEENDFCLRAQKKGWRHVALPGVFVSHLAGRSFGSGAADLRSRNLAQLNRLHPGYNALIVAFARDNPLARARRALDEARFRATGSAGTSAVLVTHGRGGGVQRRVRERCAEWQAAGVRPVILSPAADRSCTVSDGAEIYPNLVFFVPEQFDDLLELLRATQPVCVELHHFLDHHPDLLTLADRLQVPLDIVVHDYAWFCPRISLTGADHRYCGEPEIDVCESCAKTLGDQISDPISPGALRARSNTLFAGARRVIVPSRDTARRLQRHFPSALAEVCPWETDNVRPLRPRPPKRAKLRICVAGAVGLHKGYDILLALGRDVAARSLPIEYILVGYSHDDRPLLETEAINVTGYFQARECIAMLAQQQSDLGFLPSGIPETWSYTLSEMWEAGLPVAAFDIGAPAERIRAVGRGYLLPLGLPVERINDTFLQWWHGVIG